MEFNPASRRSRRGAKSRSPIISVNKKYGRIYFSAFAVRELCLTGTSITIDRLDNYWLLLVDRHHGDCQLTQYQGAYYLVHREMVNMIMQFEEREKPTFEIGETIEADSYVLIPITLNRPEPRRRQKTDDDDWIKRRARVASAARIVISNDESSFSGRIKTQEVIAAENILNHITALNSKSTGRPNNNQPKK